MPGVHKTRLIGCLVVPILLVFGIAALILYLGVAFDVFAPAPRVSTAQFATADTVLLAHADFEAPRLARLLEDVAGGYASSAAYVLPYECSLVLDVTHGDPPSRRMTLAVSPRHLGPLTRSRTREFLSNLRVPGIDSWTTTGLEIERGAMVLRGAGLCEVPPSPPPDTTDLTEMELQGGHLLEVALRNPGGALPAVLAPFLRGPESGGDRPGPEPHDYTALFEGISSGCLTLDLMSGEASDDQPDPSDTALVAIDLQYGNDAAAESALIALRAIRDGIVEWATEREVEVTGGLQRQGSRLLGGLHIAGFQAPLKRALEDAFSTEEDLSNAPD